MRSKNLSRRKFLIIVLAGFTLFAILLSCFIYTKEKSIQNSSALLTADVNALSKQETEKPSLPMRLKIPKINVNAAIKYVGITANGEMGVPKGPSDVAWFEPGIIPGEAGSAVIAGHYGHWKNGQGSVFDNLKKLKAGDKLYIKDADGDTIIFVMRESKIYNSNDDASNIFFSDDGASHLNLITCEGAWDKISKSYSKRLVIFTDKE